MSNRNISIVHWFPELEKHKCGYCKQPNTNCSYGMWAESLTIEDYQYLIDRGWRRSGKYCYKPVMDITCCPLYTIRCEALNFKLSKSQKKIIKRVNKYLTDPSDKSGHEDPNNSLHEVSMDAVHYSREVKNIDLDKIERGQLDLIINQRNENITSVTEVNELDSGITNEESNKMCVSTSSINHDCKPGLGADPTKPPCKKAKLIRLERKQQKLAAKGVTAPLKINPQTVEKSLEEFIEDIPESAVHNLKVRLVLTGGRSKDWNQIRSQEYQVYRKYQMKIHGDPPEKCTEKQFTSFLLESPLQYVEKPDSLPHGYGSFHQQYWLDDKLIAVGVIDILPKCVSSVYFFYDPDYRHLTLGTYGSLRELHFVRQLHNLVPEIKYYYMGFYAHTCPKMRYKAKLHPSYLLCPETYIWFPVGHCTKKLDRKKYSRFHDDLSVVDKDGCFSLSDVDPLNILIGYKGLVPFRFLKEQLEDEEDKEDYLRFGKLIGKKCIPRLLVVLRNADI